MNMAQAGGVSAPMAVPMQMQAPNRAVYAAKPTAQEDVEPKAITSEQIQAMLDENSNLIVEIITLNNQIKQAKGTGQQGDVMEKLDKKRKKLNKNLMTLAKWADESSDQPPRPPPAAYYPPQQQAQYAPRGMPMNPMDMAPQMGMAHPQMQMAPRYNQAQMQAMAQAQAQYRAHMSNMGGHAAYGNMPAAAPRYHDPSMGYGGMAPGMRPMPMGMPAGYAGGAPMGYPMAAPHGYGMMGPQQVMPRMGAAPDAGGANAGGVPNPNAARPNN